jgi:hypothetical protein
MYFLRLSLAKATIDPYERYEKAKKAHPAAKSTNIKT